MKESGQLKVTEAESGDFKEAVQNNGKESESVNDEVDIEQLLAAADFCGAGLWVYYRNKGFSKANTAFCEHLGGLASHMPSLNEILNAISVEDRQRIETRLNEAIKAELHFDEEFRVKQDGGEVDWILLEVRSLREHEEMIIYASSKKITRQRMAADELERIFERERRARDEAEIANRAKDFFLNFVSHELRSPLNAILMWSKILLTREVDEATRRKALETIEKSAEVQAKLISDVADSARVASGRIKLENRATNLVTILRSVFEGQRPSAEAAGLDFEFETNRDNVVIFGDPSRLQQVFVNLLSNAIKFTPRGGMVKVRLEEEESKVKVTVEDTGVGISKDILPDIFKQYVRGVPTTQGQSGLGLGLSIVKILVTKHGGTVEAKSDGVGKGAKFIVTLPTFSGESAQTSINETTTVHRRRLEGLKVLIVEDDVDSREVLQIFLEQNGAQVVAADSARAALRILSSQESNRFDVIISDLAMPEEDGYSLIKKIRSLDSNHGGDIPALALSAFASAESRRRAFEAGFHRYLTKPFEPDSVVDQIAALCNPGTGQS